MAYKQLTLGTLIGLLNQCEIDNDLRYDFAGLIPAELKSYRGYYDELAIGYLESDASVSVGDYLERLRGAIGKSYEGYKGGMFKMDKDTRVWVAEYGEVSDSYICDVKGNNHITYLLTRVEID